MTCQPLALSELFFGELPADAAAAVKRHALACADCGRALRELREDRERFAARHLAQPKLDGLYLEIERRIAGHRAQPQRRRWWPRLSGDWLRLVPPLVATVGSGALALLVTLVMTVAPPSPNACFADRVESSPLVTQAPGARLGDLDASTFAEPQLSACLIASHVAASEQPQACF